MSDTEDDLPAIDDGPFADVLRRATKRFKRCQRWESTAQQRWIIDYKFAHGDDENNYQWPDDIYQARDGGQRPTLTINKVRQHNLLIKNEARQSKQGIKYRPVGDGATREAADVIEGIVRHIQNVSRAADVRSEAVGFQVDAGVGYTRIVTEYVSPDSFDQEIYIKGIADPTACFLDPDATQPDKADARFGFIFADRPREEMEAKHTWLKGKSAPSNVVDGDDSGWVREDHVRECEYYEMSEEQDELLGSPDGATTVLRSDVPSDLVKKWEAELEAQGDKLKRRKITRNTVHWYKIIGDRVVDDAPWAGSTVPIIPYIGEETVIDQQLDRKGHTRYLKSAQRILNYNRSAAVEYGALQSKTPYVAAAAAIEGYETYWETANVVNHAMLPYNHKDDTDEPIPAPQRQQPPQSAPAFIEGAQAADNDMMLASGQYQAELGAPGNEVSGKAINERQRQGDRATYQFADNQAIAIRREGTIILELIPKIYDTPRVLRIIGEDGRTESSVRVDPNASAPVQQAAQEVVFNPNVGRYEVASDVGPDYATQRQEAFNAVVQILTQAPQLIDKIGDLLFQVADFPLADKIAERLKPGLPPEAQAAITELQKQLQHGNKMLGEAMQALAEERLKNKAKDSKANIDAYDADTRRLGVIKDMLPLDPADMQRLIHQTVAQALQDNLGPVIGATVSSLQRQQMGVPPPGAADESPISVPDIGKQLSMPGGASPQPAEPLGAVQ